MTYTKTGPFTDYSGSPGISAAFLNNVEAALVEADGSGWTAYTPVANFNAGSGNVYSYSYRAVAGQVRIRGRTTMGTSPSIPNFFALSVPSGYSYLDLQNAPIGVASFSKSGVTSYSAFVQYDGSGSIDVFGIGTNGARNLPATVMSWAQGDFFDVNVTLAIN